MKMFFFILICQLGNQLFSQDQGNSIKLNITNIKLLKGLIRVEIYNNELDYSKEKKPYIESAFPVEALVLSVTFQNIPKGFYAIIIYHDINSNDQNDETSLGIPIEPFGFSNNIKPNMSIPKFDKTKFQIQENDIEMNIKLQQYEKKWGIGIASDISSSPYLNCKTRQFAIPILIYQSEDFELLGPRARYSLWHNQKIDFSLGVRINYEGYNSSDSTIFKGMSDRKITIESGIEFQYHLNQKWSIKTDAYHDILGINNGIIGSISIEKKIIFEKCQITPLIGVKWENQNYSDYYYGVQSSESIDNRPEYHPKYSIDPYMEIETVIYWNATWASLITVSGTYFDKNIRKSPLIGQNFNIGLTTAIVYRF